MAGATPDTLVAKTERSAVQAMAYAGTRYGEVPTADPQHRRRGLPQQDIGTAAYKGIGDYRAELMYLVDDATRELVMFGRRTMTDAKERTRMAFALQGKLPVRKDGRATAGGLERAVQAGRERLGSLSAVVRNP